jgi:GTP-binding protein
LRYKGPVFSISALAREGLQPLIERIYHHVAENQKAAPLPDLRFDTELPAHE